LFVSLFDDIIGLKHFLMTLYQLMSTLIWKETCKFSNVSLQPLAVSLKSTSLVYL